MSASRAVVWVKRLAVLILLSAVTSSPLSAQTVQTVRESDSVLNGALIGAGVAVASGLFLCTRTEPWRNCRDDVGPILRIGAIGAAVGAGIDALIRRRRPVLSAELGSVRLHAVPLVAGGAAGVRVSLGF